MANCKVIINDYISVIDRNFPVYFHVTQKEKINYGSNGRRIHR